jgi:hypothetical protein
MFNPQVGDPCHWILYTDIEPCTVVARSPRVCKVQINKTKIDKPPVVVPGGFAGVVTENATWEILDQLEIRVLVFTLRKNGIWKLQGSGLKERGNVLQPGHRKFYDYGF